MTARSANTHLENITRGLQRTTLPRLPPAPGFEGDQEYLEQVRLWKAWIAWEKDDPLVVQADDPETYRQRILYVYKQALMALYFWPELWVDAAEWCFDNNITGQDKQDTGLQFLVDGLQANPESALIALKHADRIESTKTAREDDPNKYDLAQTVREPCNKVLETLYDMLKKLKDQETAALAKIEEDAADDAGPAGNADADDEDEGEINERPSTDVKNAKIKAVKEGFAVQTQILRQHISHLWIAIARIYRRLQGQGNPKTTPPTGLRAIFMEARQRGNINSDVYAAVSHMEWEIYHDHVATKIFERGAKLFPEEELYFVEYLKHLHTKRDFTSEFPILFFSIQCSITNTNRRTSSFLSDRGALQDQTGAHSKTKTHLYVFPLVRSTVWRISTGERPRNPDDAALPGGPQIGPFCCQVFN